MRAIKEVIGLDLFGVDCSLLDDGTMLVFEANASMRFFKSGSPRNRPAVQRTAAIMQELIRQRAMAPVKYTA